jgi:hypothetical protein
MNTNYKELLPADFSDESRVWIYQSNRLFSISEALAIEEMLEGFVKSWHTHGTPVKGYGNLFFGQFIVLIADETAAGVSGCSTDSSVRLIKQVEQQFGVSLFDMQLLAFLIGDKLQVLPLPQIKYAGKQQFLNGDTLYFNNTVQTKRELENNWIIPVKDSWLGKKISFEKETAEK